MRLIKACSIEYRHMWKPWRCYAETLILGGLADYLGKWSCVFKGIEMDKFPSWWDGITPDSLKIGVAM